MKAHEILNNAAGHLADRAKTYDKPEGERSIEATVAAFNAVTGHEITETQGWLFMALLKAVRSQQGEFKIDSFEDGAAYFALAGESAAKSAEIGKDSVKASDEPAVETNAPDWKDAPEWAQWLVQSLTGEWRWCASKPEPTAVSWYHTGKTDSAMKSAGINHNWRETLEQRPNNDDWIEWHGGECPVGKAVFVDIKLRGATTIIKNSGAPYLRWQHNGTDGDIIAYRIVKG